MGSFWFPSCSVKVWVAPTAFNWFVMAELQEQGEEDRLRKHTHICGEDGKSGRETAFLKSISHDNVRMVQDKDSFPSMKYNKKKE